MQFTHLCRSYSNMLWGSDLLSGLPPSLSFFPLLASSALPLYFWLIDLLCFAFGEHRLMIVTILFVYSNTFANTHNKFVSGYSKGSSLLRRPVAREPWKPFF